MARLLGLLAVSILAFTNAAYAKDRNSTATFRPGKGSYLVYLDTLLKTNQTLLEVECQKRRYDFTVYYRMTLFRMCTPDLGEYNAFCVDLADERKNRSNVLTERIDKRAEKHQIYGVGLYSDQRDLAYKACTYFDDYFSSTNQNYTEWLVHATPFALPVACGFSVSTYNRSDPSSFDCMAMSSQAVLYFLFALDGLIVACVVIANCVILVVTLREPKMRTLHGYFRVSLACSDLLIGCVLSASMNTTYRMFMATHPFLREGESPKMWHYHDSAYVDAFGFITVMSFATSIFTLVGITIERFHINTKKRLETRDHKIRLVACLTFALIWVLAFVIALVPILVPGFPYSVTALGVIIAPKFYIVYLIFLGLSLLLVWGLNLAMCCACAKPTSDVIGSDATVLRNNNTKDDGHVPSVSRKVEETNTATSLTTTVTSSNTDVIDRKQDSSLPPCGKLSSNSHWTLVRTVRAVVIAFTVAILPCIAVMVSGLSPRLEPRSRGFDPQAKAAWTSCAYLASRILFANSFVNAIIYNYISPDFRAAAKRLFWCRRRLENSTGD